MAHAFNPSTREAEAGGSLGVRGQPNIKELVPGQAPKAKDKPCLVKQKKKKTTKKRLIQKQTQMLVVYTFNLRVWESHTFNPRTRELETETEAIFWEERVI